MHKLILASAGAGKSRRIVKQALKMAEIGQTVLLLTYTQNNQKELIKKICQINRHKPSNIIIKGWFAFLLEDMIRPYQKCIFQNRIPGIYFNSSDPHIKNGRTLKGRSEKLNGDYNPLYFLTILEQRAHTTYLSKLAVRVYNETKGKNTQRLAEIYDAIFIDEAQDLVGWDFEIINALAKIKKFPLICVGDFRQTIYTTSVTRKSPKTNIQKFNAFKEIGFEPEHMNVSWRCIQSICDFADLVHANENYYTATTSQVKEVPNEFKEHLGVFTVSSGAVSEYIERYNPVFLRRNKVTHNEICNGHKTFNFGEAKGLGFDRILIFPTQKHENFILGKVNVFDEDKTEKAKNTFYVAITRAKYSVAIVLDSDKIIGTINIWTPQS